MGKGSTPKPTLRRRPAQALHFEKYRRIVREGNDARRIGAPPVKRTRVVWTRTQEDALQAYMLILPMQWVQIIKYDAGKDGASVLTEFTDRHIKDKARTMARTMIRYVF